MKKNSGVLSEDGWCCWVVSKQIVGIKIYLSCCVVLMMEKCGFNDGEER